MTVYKSMGHRGREPEPFQRAPAAFIKDILRSDLRRAVQIHYDEVGEIAFPDIASFGYAETFCYRMAHFFHHLLQADPAFFYIMQHQQKGMLYQRQPGMRFFISAPASRRRQASIRKT